MTTVNLSIKKAILLAPKDANETELVYVQSVLRSYCHDSFSNNKNF